MRLSPRAKLAGLIASLAIHGSALAFFADFSEDKGTAQAGLGGVEVALAPMGGAPGSEARAVESTETVKPTEVTEAVKPIETAEVPDVPVTPVEQARPVEPVKPIEPVKPVEPVKVKEEPEKVKMAEVPPPPPPPPVKPVVKKPEPPKPVQQPQPQEIKPQQVAKAEPAPVQAEAAPAPSVTGSAGKSGAQDSQNAGTTNSTSASAGGGMPGSSADYLALVQAWLERHKEYPRRAQLRRIEGTAVLRFVMDREGKLVSYRLERGSGHSVLDEAVREMIERASPFPPLPPEIQQANLELVVPVSFYLR
ncbi:energy transducer TonB [Oceanibaculum indicum]|uniref:Protein TonB n=1 Tax=Oceanibaculum indicum P24 TaxID=1207063 RepID=K2JII3_9PROT|nr:energy transducer TonB [Oceanibaculum indicum]EKE75058.1 TonB family protein [Oceanibaculum indicum P24]